MGRGEVSRAVLEGMIKFNIFKLISRSAPGFRRRGGTLLSTQNEIRVETVTRVGRLDSERRGNAAAEGNIAVRLEIFYLTGVHEDVGDEC